MSADVRAAAAPGLHRKVDHLHNVASLKALDWRHPKEDITIRLEGAKRIGTIFKRGGAGNRDEKREYRVLIALEHLCYFGAQSREEYVDPRSFEILLHRVASEKAKRRRDNSSTNKQQAASFHEMLNYYLIDSNAKQQLEQHLQGTDDSTSVEDDRQKYSVAKSQSNQKLVDKLPNSVQLRRQGSNNNHSFAQLNVNVHPDTEEHPILSPFNITNISQSHREEMSIKHERTMPMLLSHPPEFITTQFPSPTNSVMNELSPLCERGQGFHFNQHQHYNQHQGPLLQAAASNYYQDHSDGQLLKRKPFSDDSSFSTDSSSVKKARRAFSEQTRAA